MRYLPRGGFLPRRHGCFRYSGFDWVLARSNSIDFIPCLYACACLGAVNPQEDCQDPMLKNKNHPEGCHESSGYRANSTLCADCLPGYSRDGTGKCKQCGERGLNKTLPFVFGFMLLLCLLFLVWTTVVKRGGAFKNSDGAKKIFISFLQLAALSTTMQIHGLATT